MSKSAIVFGGSGFLGSHVADALSEGGHKVTRFEKIRVFYKDILQRPLSEERFQKLCLRYSQLVVEGVVVAP